METKKKYITIQDLEIYRLAKELSDTGWEIYEPFDWQTKKIMGDQFIESTDSVGANIAEGYARFHYLDRIKFLYNARGSLSECSDHWLELIMKRKKVNELSYKKFKSTAKNLNIKLNNFISATYKSKLSSQK